MNEILAALATSAALLLPILIFMTLAAIAAVKRGETDAHHMHGGLEASEDSGSAAVAAAPPRELSVIEILLFAAALFGVAMLALMGMSMAGRM